MINDINPIMTNTGRSIDYIYQPIFDHALEDQIGSPCLFPLTNSLLMDFKREEIEGDFAGARKF